jgi:hypothetical protein
MWTPGLEVRPTSGTCSSERPAKTLLRHSAPRYEYVYEIDRAYSRVFNCRSWTRQGWTTWPYLPPSEVSSFSVIRIGR